jgi:hypothetical protein
MILIQPLMAVTCLNASWYVSPWGLRLVVDSKPHIDFRPMSGVLVTFTPCRPRAH